MALEKDINSMKESSQQIYETTKEQYFLLRQGYSGVYKDKESVPQKNSDSSSIANVFVILLTILCFGLLITICYLCTRKVEPQVVFRDRDVIERVRNTIEPQIIERKIIMEPTFEKKIYTVDKYPEARTYSRDPEPSYKSNETKTYGDNHKYESTRQYEPRSYENNKEHIIRHNEHPISYSRQRDTSNYNEDQPINHQVSGSYAQSIHKDYEIERLRQQYGINNQNK